MAEIEGSGDGGVTPGDEGGASADGAAATDAPTVIWERADADASPDGGAPDSSGDAWSDAPPAPVAHDGAVHHDHVLAGTTDPHGDAWTDLPPTSAYVPDRRGESEDMAALATERAALHIDQRDNAYNTRDDFDRTCGLATSTELLRDFGKDVDLDVVIGHALIHDQAALDGGTSAETIRSVLEDFGVPANAHETATVESLAGDVRQGHGVIALVDSDTWWRTGDADPARVLDRTHAIYITGVRWDADGRPVAFHVSDTSRGDAGRDLVEPASHLRQAFELPGGWSRETGTVAPGGHAIVTDHQRDIARMRG
jgi:hypothetical protein